MLIVSHQSSLHPLPQRNNNRQLVLLDVRGDRLLVALNDAVSMALSSTSDSNKQGTSYPYGAGIRFVVDGSSPASLSTSHVSNVEVFIGGSWGDLDMDTIYRVVTTNYLAAGNEGYGQLNSQRSSEAEDTDIVELGLIREVFLEYALSWGVLQEPSREKFSTKEFIR